MIVLLLGLVSAASAQPSTRPINDRCPVTPEEASSPLHEITFRGAAVRFCCGKCRSQFLLEPQAFIAQLPHVSAAAENDAPGRSTGGTRQPQGFNLTVFLHQAERLVDRWRPYLIGMAVAGAIHLYAVRRVRNRLAREAADSASSTSKRSLPTRALETLAHPSTLLVIVLGLVCLAQWEHGGGPVSPAAEAASRDHLSNTAARFAADMARQGVLQGPEFVALLDKTYCRGNDERAATLFNGGVYRTCTFHVSLQSDEGEVVRPGQNVSGRRLFVRVEVRRAAGALQSHFTDESMTRSCLVLRGVMSDTLPADAAADAPTAHPLVTLDPGARWAAGCPVARVDRDGTLQRFDGMILLCPESSGEPFWPGAHYGIQYSLRIEHGVLTPSSKLWMGALLFTEDLPDHRLHEWLSWRPLPEIPADFQHVSETDQLELPATNTSDK